MRFAIPSRKKREHRKSSVRKTSKGPRGSFARSLEVILKSRAFRLFIALILAISTLLFLYGFISAQIEELSRIEFAKEVEEGFLPHDINVAYNTDSVFTLGIFYEEESSGREVLASFALVRIDPVTQRGDVFVIDPEVYVDIRTIPGRAISRKDVSTARIRDLMVIGGLQTPPMTLSFPLYQLEELFALHVDGYVMFTHEMSGSIDVFSPGMSLEEAINSDSSYEERASTAGEYWVDFIDSVTLLNVWRNRELLSSIESNMDIVDVYRFFKNFSKIPQDNVRIHFPYNDDLVEEVDERGEMVDLITIQAVEDMFEDVERDERMDREQARIEVFNGTIIDGLGSHFDRWIRHLGGEVIRVKNAPGRVEKTTMYVTDAEKYSYTVERVQKLFESCAIVEGRPDFVTTGDIIIVVGMDF